MKKYSISISSRTGNTALLGEQVRECLKQKQKELVYDGAPAEKAKEADVVFIGFWTDKGTCDQDTKTLLESLEEKDVFLFGTAGFGVSEEYFEQILHRVKTILPTSNRVIGTYMCQGKMNMAVRNRYEMLQKEHPEDTKYEMLIANFDQALTHPDEDDISKLKQAVFHAI